MSFHTDELIVEEETYQHLLHENSLRMFLSLPKNKIEILECVGTPAIDNNGYYVLQGFNLHLKYAVSLPVRFAQ